MRLAGRRPEVGSSGNKAEEREVGGRSAGPRMKHSDGGAKRRAINTNGLV